MEQKDNNVYAPPTARVADPKPEKSTTRPKQIKFAVVILTFSIVITSIVEIMMRRFSFISLGIFILMIWLIRRISQGRNWARIALLMADLTGLVLLSTLMPLSRLFAGVIENWVALINLSEIRTHIIFQAVGMALLFIGPGSDWFRKNTNS